MIHGSSYGGQYAFAKNSHGSYWNKMYPAVIKHCKGQITTREKGLKVKHQTTQTIFTTVVIICTIWLFNIAMENDPFIDGLPIKNCDFPWLC
jgi:amino acid transporter